jgi:outer membrane protein assembly factor BamA
LKFIFHTLLYLNIYLLLAPQVAAQEIRLQWSAEPAIPESLLDSLGIQESWSTKEQLTAHLDTLTMKLQRAGYLEATAAQLSQINDSLYDAKFQLGERYSKLRVYYNKSEVSQRALQRIAQEVTDSYFELSFQRAESALAKLNAQMAEDGNTFASLRLTQLTTQPDRTVEARLEVRDAPRRTIDSVALVGYEKFPRSFLRYYAGVRTGSTFSQRKLLRQNDAIDNLGFASSAKPPEALFRSDSTVVYFYLQKENNNLFDGILGFATDEETQRLQFNGYLNLELNNNLNYGEQLLINYKADGNEQTNFRVRARAPYLLKTPFGLAAELTIFKRDSTFVTTDQQARITYQLNPQSELYAGYKTYESNLLLNDIVLGLPVEDYTARYFLLGATFSKQQSSRLFPVKTHIALETELGAREKDSITEDQVRGLATAFHLLNLNATNSIFLKNTTGALFSETFLVNELFRFGGINSIRGFNENSIDASLFSVLNTEYRYMFNPSIYVHSIIDLAYFENASQDLKQKLYSFGFGFGMSTRAGIFQFVVANGNIEGQEFNFSNTKIHISLTSRF